MGPVTRKRKLEEEKLSSNVAAAEEPSKRSKSHEAIEFVDTKNRESNIDAFEIKNGDKSIVCKKYLTRTKETKDKEHFATPSLVFTHGAGGGIETPAIAEFAEGFASIDTALCFQGTMNLKSRVKSFHAVIENQDWGLALGGRSMGARAAVMTANEYGKTEALVLVSYPLVSEKGDVRDEILLEISKNIEVLFVIGDGDKMCPLDRLNEVREKMKATSWLMVVKGADHGMSVKPKSATEHFVRETGKVAAQWLKRKDSKKLEAAICWNDEAGEAAMTAWHGDNSTPDSIPKSTSKRASGEDTEEEEKETKVQSPRKRKKRA